MSGTTQELLQFIIDNRRYCGILADFSPADMQAWADGRSREFLEAVALGARRSKLAQAGIII